MTDKALSVLGVPGTLTVAGRTFAVPPQTPGDVGRTRDAMRRLALAECSSPLDLVNAHAAKLAPAVFSEAVRQAVAMGSGGGVEPSQEAVLRAYDSLDGVRWRLWYQARKAEPGLARDEVDRLVTDENVYDVADALLDALGLRALDPKGPPASGTG